jgi:hypothetical protein
MGLILLAICAGNCVAQSQSSVSQTVTFGVQRTAVPLFAANFSQINSDGESTTPNPAPLKLTVGSDVRSEEFAIGTRTSAVRKMRHQKIIGSDEFVTASDAPNPFRFTPPKSVITVTE